MKQLQLLTGKYLEDYNRLPADNAEQRFKDMPLETSAEKFAFYTSVSAVASSKIEGEQIELDSFLKYKMYNTGIAKELLEKPNDLFEAYLFAQKNGLDKNSFLKSHSILSEHLLIKGRRGKLRNSDMIILNHEKGTVEYEACPVQEVEREINKLFADIHVLLTESLTFQEVLYYAAFIHLAFVKIHPFDDGNGRAGRLLEKWFLAQKLGIKAWQVPTEKMYYHNVRKYYKNLQQTGFSYHDTDYAKAIDFLRMLPKAI